MKKKYMAAKLILVMALAMATIPFNTLGAAAASVSFPALSSSAYCEFYATKYISVYKDTGCKTRGTSSPSQAYNAEIYPGDTCRILKIADSYVQLQYPTSSGLRTGYIKRSEIIGVSAPSEKVTAAGKATTNTKAANSSYGYTEKGDTVYKLGTSGSYTQIIYTAKSGNRSYKLGYVLTSEYGSKIKGTAAGAGANSATGGSGAASGASAAASTYYRPITGTEAGYKGDTGLDITAPIGTPVYAIADGTLEYSEFGHVDKEWQNPPNTAYSLNYKLANPISYKGKTIKYVYYTHLKSVRYSQKDGVSSPRKVKKGELLGYSGIANNSSHLHISLFTKRDGAASSCLSMEDTRSFFESKKGQKWTAGKW